MSFTIYPIIGLLDIVLFITLHRHWFFLFFTFLFRRSLILHRMSEKLRLVRPPIEIEYDNHE